jgi:hypothetical protein
MGAGTKRKWHIMIWFDRGVLRPAGSIVPFAVLAVRSVVLLIIGAWAQRKGHQDTAQRRTAPALATLMPLCARVYLGIMVLRGVVYLTHYAFMAVGLLPFHLVRQGQAWLTPVLRLWGLRAVTHSLLSGLSAA